MDKEKKQEKSEYIFKSQNMDIYYKRKICIYMYEHV